MHHHELDDAKHRDTLAKEQAREAEEKIRLLEERVGMSEEQIHEANRKSTRLECELPQTVVEDFKASATFGVDAEDFLATKLIELYEALVTQIKGDDPNFHFE